MGGGTDTPTGAALRGAVAVAGGGFADVVTGAGAAGGVAAGAAAAGGVGVLMTSCKTNWFLFQCPS